jgi:hypothetical protein
VQAVNTILLPDEAPLAGEPPLQVNWEASAEASDDGVLVDTNGVLFEDPLTARLTDPES